MPSSYLSTDKRRRKPHHTSSCTIAHSKRCGTGLSCFSHSTRPCSCPSTWHSSRRRWTTSHCSSSTRLSTSSFSSTSCSTFTPLTWVKPVRWSAIRDWFGSTTWRVGSSSISCRACPTIFSMRSRTLKTYFFYNHYYFYLSLILLLALRMINYHHLFFIYFYFVLFFKEIWKYF